MQSGFADRRNRPRTRRRPRSRDLLTARRPFPEPNVRPNKNHKGRIPRSIEDDDEYEDDYEHAATRLASF
jgi:hypothetical protein